MLSDSLLIALRNIQRRKLRAWLTMLGIFIGIAAVVSLIGLGEGLRTGISSQFGVMGTDVLTVQASGIAFAGMPGQGAVELITDDLAEKIEKVNNVDSAFNRYLESGTIIFNNQQSIGIIASIPNGRNRKIFEEMLNIEAEDGRLLKEIDTKKVFLGYNFIEDSEFNKVMKVGDRIIINEITFEIVGFMKRKGSFMLDNSVIMNEDDVLKYLKDEDDDSVNIIAVKVKDENKIDKTKEDVEKLLRKERDVKIGEENFEVQSPQAMLDALNSALFAVQLFVYIIASISLLVGGIGIMNTMYTAVLERSKEIGIMKSIGAKNSTIFSIFFIESGLLGTVGGIIGISLGLILAYGLAAVGRMVLGVELIQADIGFTLIIGSLLFSFVMGTIFGVLPAIQASKLQPVESLRSVK